MSVPARKAALRIPPDRGLQVLRVADWLAVGLYVVTAIAGVYLGAATAFWLRTEAGWSTYGIALVALLASVVGFIADRHAGAVGMARRSIGRLRVGRAAETRLAGLLLAYAWGFSILAIAILVVPSAANGGLGHRVALSSLLVALALAGGGVAAQLLLQRTLGRAGGRRRRVGCRRQPHGR